MKFATGNLQMIVLCLLLTSSFSVVHTVLAEQAAATGPDLHRPAAAAHRTLAAPEPGPGAA